MKPFSPEWYAATSREVAELPDFDLQVHRPTGARTPLWSADTCERCNGSGWLSPKARQCPRCKGTGKAGAK